MIGSIRVCICDSSPVLRYGLKSMLATDPRISPADEASSHEDLLNSYVASDIDVAIIDIEDDDTLEFPSLCQFHKQRPDVKIIIFSHTDNRDQILRLLNIGIQGFQVKDAEASEIIDAVHKVYEGGTSMADCVTSTLFNQISKNSTSPQPDLSEREEQVLKLIATGKTNSDIANKLYISVRTVKFHVSSIFNKLKVKNRTQAAAMWTL